MTICGWLTDANMADAASVVERMGHALRVDDAQRFTVFDVHGLAVGILDRDDPAAGANRHEPAVSPDRRFWLWMAGEAYTTSALCPLRSATHSRRLPFRVALLEAVLTKGLDAVTASLNGRYQIVLFDSAHRTVTIVNDRFGSLPLFWGCSNAGMAFAGGVRGVLMAPGVSPKPDADAIQEAVTFGGFRLGDRTNIAGVKRLRGGSTLTMCPSGDVLVRSRWSWPGEAPASSRSDAELIEEAHALWRQTIAARLDGARHPGQTLSGGLDSRAILAEAAPLAPSWTALTYGVTGCDDARYAQRAAQVAGATWVFHPLYSGRDPDWLERRSAYIQETDGLIQLVDLMHCETLHLQVALLDVHLSGYVGDVVCGPTYDGVVDAPTLLAKVPYTGSPIGWSWGRAMEWATDAIRELGPSDAKFAIYEHKFPQAIHAIFQTYAPYVRLRTPFTDYALFDFFAAIPRHTRVRLYRAWLTQKYPSFFRRIPDQRTGLPAAAPAPLVTLERLRRGGMRILRRATGPNGVAGVRIRAYHDEDTRWRAADIRRRIAATILKPGGLCVDMFGRVRLQRVLDDWFDRGLGPIQVVGALYTYEKYFEGLSDHLRQAARVPRIEAMSSSNVQSLMENPQ